MAWNARKHAGRRAIQPPGRAASTHGGDQVGPVNAERARNRYKSARLGANSRPGTPCKPEARARLSYAEAFSVYSSMVS